MRESESYYYELDLLMKMQEKNFIIIYPSLSDSPNPTYIIIYHAPQ